MNQYRNPDEFDYQRFDKIELLQDFHPVSGLKVKAGAVGLLTAEYNGYGITFDTSDPINEGKLIESQSLGSFQVFGVEPHTTRLISIAPLKSTFE